MTAREPAQALGNWLLVAGPQLKRVAREAMQEAGYTETEFTTAIAELKAGGQLWMPKSAYPIRWNWLTMRPTTMADALVLNEALRSGRINGLMDSHLARLRRDVARVYIEQVHANSRPQPHR